MAVPEKGEIWRLVNWAGIVSQKGQNSPRKGGICPRKGRIVSQKGWNMSQKGRNSVPERADIEEKGWKKVERGRKGLKNVQAELYGAVEAQLLVLLRGPCSRRKVVVARRKEKSGRLLVLLRVVGYKKRWSWQWKEDGWKNWIECWSCCYVLGQDESRRKSRELKARDQLARRPSTADVEVKELSHVMRETGSHWASTLAIALLFLEFLRLKNSGFQGRGKSTRHSLPLPSLGTLGGSPEPRESRAGTLKTRSRIIGIPFGDPCCFLW
ncbi:hypothetical protein C8J56DRAFT_901279 [Mycena floridula]|nr:hypothetical protein C8J56DRAFT_901279 [Mycena floridula]